MLVIDQACKIFSKVSYLMKDLPETGDQFSSTGKHLFRWAEGENEQKTGDVWKMQGHKRRNSPSKIWLRQDAAETKYWTKLISKVDITCLIP